MISNILDFKFLSDANMDIHQQNSQRIRELRLARGYTLEELANGLEVSLVSLFGGVEFPTSFKPLLRHAEQPIWQDPESGYIRRSISPLGLKISVQLVEVHFPAHVHHLRRHAT
jgi:hypothetical protein